MKLFVNSEWSSYSAGYEFEYQGETLIYGTNAFSDIQSAVDAAAAKDTGLTTTITVADGTYDGDVYFRTSAGASGGTYYGDGTVVPEQKGDIKIVAAGDAAVITGTFFMGLMQNKTTNVSHWDAAVALEGLKFDNDVKGASISIQSSGALTVTDCSFEGDGLYRVTVVSNCNTPTADFDGCSFTGGYLNLGGGQQINFTDCTITQVHTNIQSGYGVAFNDCTFDKVLGDDLTDAGNFYVIRTNDVPITMDGCTVNVDSTVSAEAPASDKNWTVFWQRQAGNTSWQITDLEVNYTDGAAANSNLQFNLNGTTDAANAQNRVEIDGLTVGAESAADVNAILGTSTGYIIVSGDGMTDALYLDGEKKADKSKLYVNSTYTAESTLPAGQLWGYNAFADIQSAVDAAAVGVETTIDLAGDLSGANAVSDGKNIVFTGTANIRWQDGWFMIGSGGSGTDRDAVTTVTFKNATITSTDPVTGTASTGFQVSAKGALNVNGGIFNADTVTVAKNGKFTVTGVSTVNTTLAGDGWMVADGATLSGNIVNNSFIGFVNDNTLATDVTGTGKIYVGRNGVSEDLAASLTISGDVAVDGAYFMVDDNAKVNIASGNTFTFTGDSVANTDCYRFVFAGGDMEVGGVLNIENSATRFSRADIDVIAGAVVNAEQHICVYNSDVTVNGIFNVENIVGRGVGLIIGHNSNDFGGAVNFVVSGSGAALNIDDCGSTPAVVIYAHTKGNGLLKIADGAVFNTAGIVENNSTISVTDGSFTAGTVTNSSDITFGGESSFDIGAYSYTGSGYINFADGAKLLDSSVTGTTDGAESHQKVRTQALGALEIAGDVTITNGFLKNNSYDADGNYANTGALTVSGSLNIVGMLQYYGGDVTGDGAITVQSIALAANTVTADITAEYGYIYQNVVFDGGNLTMNGTNGEPLWIGNDSREGHAVVKNGGAITGDAGIFITGVDASVTADNGGTVSGNITVGTTGALNAVNSGIINSTAITNSGNIIINKGTLTGGSVANTGLISIVGSGSVIDAEITGSTIDGGIVELRDGAVFTNSKNISTRVLYVGYNNANASDSEAKLTVAAGTTVAAGEIYQRTDGNVEVDGTLRAGGWQIKDSKAVINKGGKMVQTTNGVYLRNAGEGSTLTVKGILDFDHGANNMVDIVNVNIESGSKLVVDGGSITSTHSSSHAADAGDQYGIDVKEGGTFEVKSGNVDIDNLITNGITTVTGESTVNITSITGSGKFYLDDADITDSVMGGEVTALGQNTISGTNTTGIFNVGYGETLTEQARVKITGTFNATDTYINSAYDSVLEIGDAAAARTTANFNNIYAFGDLKVTNADFTYDYICLRNDVNITNSTVNNIGVETYTGGAAVITADSTTWNAGAFVRFGEYAGMYGNTAVTLQNGTKFNAGDVKLIEQDGKTVKLTLNNSTMDVTSTVSGRGLNVGAGAEVVVENASTINVAGILTNAGTLTIDKTSTLDVDTITNTDTGTITINAANTLTATSITNNGIIRIDVAGLTGQEYKAIDLSQSGKLTGAVEIINNNGYDIFFGDDGDITLKYDAAVALIGDTKYYSVKDALAAVDNGETITMREISGSELSKKLIFSKDGKFTLTGSAMDYEQPVVTLQNETGTTTLNIEDAEIAMPELDARQNATINVKDSVVADAGGNSIVKSYYNGAINISGDSVVDTMQLTTMGYINISGDGVADTADPEVTATWQTNIYGNGLVTVRDGAVFNTAALHVTGQAYNDRDNTDADRVGKDAELLVDNATLNVGTNVYSYGGADYNYNSAYGINIGTKADANGVLNLQNGAVANFRGADGETVNVGANGTITVTDSTLTVGCRTEGGTVTLVNAGTITVTNESVITAQSITNAGTITLDHTSQLVYSGDITGTITVDASGYTAGAYKLIDYTGSDSRDEAYYKAIIGEANYSDNYKVVDGDLWLTNAETDVLYINAAFSTYELGEHIAYGKYYGINAFSEFGKYFDNTRISKDTTKIVVESDLSEESFVQLVQYSDAQNVKIANGKEGGVTINIAGSLISNSPTWWESPDYDPTSDHHEDKTFTFEKDVTLNITGGNGDPGQIHAQTANFELNNNVTAGQVWASAGGTLTINAGAKVNSSDYLSIRNGLITVKGNVVDRKTTTEEASLTWGYADIGYGGGWINNDYSNNALVVENAVVSGGSYVTLGRTDVSQGEIKATNSVVSVGSIDMKVVNYNGTNYGQYITLDNSELKVKTSVNMGINSRIIANDSDISAETITIAGSENGASNIQLTNSTLTADTVTNNGIITVSDSTFTAGTVTNSGTVLVSGESKLQITSASGNAIKTSDSTTLLDGTSVSGINVATLGDLTIDGNVSILNGYLYNYYVKDADGNKVFNECTLTVTEGSTLTGGNLQYYHSDITGDGKINVVNVMLRDSTVTTDITASYGLYFYKDTIIDGATITHGHSTDDQVAWIRGNTTFKNGAKFVLEQDDLYICENGVNFTADASEIDGVKMSLLHADNVFTLENGATADFSGAVSNLGTITVTGSTFTAATIDNAGTMTVTGSTFTAGTVTNNGSVTVNGGSFKADTFKQSSTEGATFTDVDLDVTNFINGENDGDAYAVIGGESKVQIDNLSCHFYALRLADGTTLKNGSSIVGTTSVRAMGNITFGEADTDVVHVDSFDNKRDDYSQSNTITVNGTLSISSEGKGWDTYWLGVYGSGVRGEAGAATTLKGSGTINVNTCAIFQYYNIVIEEGLTINVTDTANADLRFTETNLVIKGAVHSVGSKNKQATVQSADVTITGENASLTVDDYMLIGYETYKSDNDISNAYKSTVTVENGADLSVGGIVYVNLESQVAVDDASFTAGTLTSYGSITVTNGEMEVEGTVTNAEGAAITVSGSTFAAATVANAGTMTVTGSTFTAGTLTNSGTVTVSGESTLTVGSISVTGSITVDYTSRVTFSTLTGNDGTISVNTTGYQDGYYLIFDSVNNDYTEAQYKALFGSSWNDNFVVTNGDLYLMDVTTVTVYVNSEYSATGDNDGHIWGVDAFATLQDAAAVNPSSIVTTGGGFSGTAAFNGLGAVIDDGSFTDSVAGGWQITEDSRDWIDHEGAIDITINGGTFSKTVSGGDYVTKGYGGRIGDINLNISGGTFNSTVGGGMAYTAASSRGAAEVYGDINFTISGGTFNRRIYGGNICLNGYGDRVLVEGDVNLTIDSSASAVNIGKNIVAGSFDTGKIEGNTTVTFTGRGSNLNFTNIVSGGSGSSTYFIDSEGVWNYNTYVTGSRSIVFDNFDGDFNADIKAFTDISFIGGSEMAFTNADIRFSDISNWDVAYGSSVDAVGTNDFAGDTLDIDVNGWDTAEVTSWDIFSAAEGFFEGWDAFGSVSIGGTPLNFDGTKWAGGNYELSLEDDTEGKKLMVSFKA